MSKQRPNSLANQLRAKGINLPNLHDGTLINCGINPIGVCNIDREKYKILWTHYDMSQCITRYKWNNLPNGLTGWLIEKMLYYRGSVCGFKYGGKIYILPYTLYGEPNIYGLPYKVQPITFNGQEPSDTREDKPFLGQEFALPINLSGDEEEEATAVILYDNPPFTNTSHATSRFCFNQCLIEDIAETLARVKINVTISSKKIGLQVRDAKQKSVVEKELGIAFSSDSPYFTYTDPMPVEQINDTGDIVTDELFNTIKNYDAMRCFMNGIDSKNFGTDKKERLVSGELAGNETQIDYILYRGLEYRKEFCDKMNKLFGLKMEVTLYRDEFDLQNEASMEVNGNNKTKLEEEEEL